MDHKTDTDSERAAFDRYWLSRQRERGFGGALTDEEMLARPSRRDDEFHAYQAGRASLAASAATDCTRCSGSGEDPQGFYDQSRGDAGHTHDGPCRECGGSGVAASAGSEPVAWSNEYAVRGYFASTLKCWHRLTDKEADELVALFQFRTAPAAGAVAGPGWKLVPVEPTDAMNEAGTDAGDGHDWAGADAVYKAMLAAAPTPAAQADSGVQEDAADPLQGAANWLNDALVNCNVRDIQHHLFIGYNRAKRLHDAALAAKGGA